MRRRRRGEDESEIGQLNGKQEIPDPEAYPYGKRTCARCADSGRLPLPVFDLGRWYQRTYPCSCWHGDVFRKRTRAKYRADEVPGAPAGLSVYELTALWWRLNGRETLLEAAQSLVDDPPQSTGRGKSIDGQRILDAVVDAMERESGTAVVPYDYQDPF